MNTTILKNGTVITAADTYQADILIDRGTILRMGTDLNSPGAQIIDVSGKYLLPGGVDPHTHFALPMFDTVSSDDHYSGHKAAAFGGTTTVMDFVPQDTPSLVDSISAWHARADAIAAIDFSFHMNITDFNPVVAKEIPTLPDLGITTLKVFMAYNGRLRLQDGEIFQVLRIAREHGLLTMLHAENGDVIDVLVAEAVAAGHRSAIWHAHTRPAWGAVEAFLRGVSLAAQARAPLYIVHMNTAGEVDQLRYARDRGVQVMGETCPQYLFFTEDDLEKSDGAKYVCSPPIRKDQDNAGLWLGLTEGVIQTVGTDHCPFFFDGTQPIIYEGEEIAISGKEMGASDFRKIPNGLPGVADRMPILWTTGVNTGRLSPNQFVAVTSTNPAKIFGLYPQKGALVPGADADIVVWDPERILTYGWAQAHHRTDYNLYEGWKLKGYPEKVFLRGELIVDGEQWFGRPGMGRYLSRLPHAPVL
jgi:dihydropyrimidinase